MKIIIKKILSCFLLSSLGLGFLSACQTVPYQGQARDVKRKPRVEGIVSIPLEHRPEDRSKANEVMNSNCGSQPVIVLEEGEVVVGQTTQTSAKETERASTEKSMGKLFGLNVMTGEAAGKNTSSASTTTAVKEWHISYKCETKASAKAP